MLHKLRYKVKHKPVLKWVPSHGKPVDVRVLREGKPVFRVSDQIRLKPVCSATETSQNIGNLLLASSHSDSFQKANNKGADQTARVRSLVCTSVVRMQQFLVRGSLSRPNYKCNIYFLRHLRCALF